jgi:hypothetical protein
MDAWENGLARGALVDDRIRAVFDVTSTRPNLQPWLTNESDWRLYDYPFGYVTVSPIAQPIAASDIADIPSDGEVNPAPSQQLSVPSAATSAPIPY